jgi:hypothetical protein
MVVFKWVAFVCFSHTFKMFPMAIPLIALACFFSMLRGNQTPSGVQHLTKVLMKITQKKTKISFKGFSNQVVNIYDFQPE